MTRLVDETQLNWILANTAKRFTIVHDLGAAINQALEELGRYSGAERAYVFEFHDDENLMDNTFEWCIEGVEPQQQHLKNQAIDMFPWWMSKIAQGELLYIPDVSQLPPEASNEREILQMQDIQSVLVLPLFKMGKLSGFVGFDYTSKTHAWAETDVSLLSLAAELFSNVLDRYERENAVKNAKAKLEEALETLKTTQAQLIQQEQMVAIGHLAAGVAHEINNPLGFVLSNASTLHEYFKEFIDFKNQVVELMKHCVRECVHPEVVDNLKTFDQQVDSRRLEVISDDIHELMGDMYQGLERIAKIVESLRFFSHIDKSHSFNPFDLNEGLKNTYVLVANKLKYIADVEMDLDEKLPIISCNGGEINQVLLNILVNTADAFSEEPKDNIGRVLVKTYSDSSHVYCEISDNGCGMSPEVQRMIFKPFFTTKAVGQGTGLGLSIAYDIVTTKHSGFIYVQSEVNKGTTFVIKLPIKQKSQAS